MFKHLNTTLIALGCLLALTGCIHKDYPPCQPLQVNLVVADKNYSNVGDITEEETLDENLPFHAYVPTMCYVLRDSETGEVVQTSGLVETTNENLTHTITFPEDLPHGRYDIVVWGGIHSLKALDFDGNPATAAFHTTEDTDEDIYIAHATVEYTPNETSFTLDMKRTMGKLIIIKELIGKAEGVNRTQKVLSDVYQHVDLKAAYEGTNEVTFSHTFTPAPLVVSKTIVAPSVSNGKSRVHMELYNDTPNTHFPVIFADDVLVEIRPNEIVVLRYSYNPEIEAFDVHVKKHNDWEYVYGLGLVD